MRNKGNLTKKVAALLLSGVTLLSGISPAIAEEPSASASPAVTAPAQTVETMPAETAAPVPEESESPTAEASAPAETAAPVATASAKAEESAVTASPSSSEESSADVGNATKETAAPAESTNPTGSPSEEKEESVKVDASKSSVYYAKDIVDYVSALSSVRTTADNKLIVHSFDDISDCIQNGKALYFDGTYIVVFDNTDDLAASKKAVSDKLGDVVFDDEAIAVDIGDDDGNDATETSEPQGEIKADANAAENAEEAANVAEEKADVTDVKTIALIDSGVNGDLADASVNLTTESDEDANGHGTKLAQIIKGLAGDKSSIISIKAFNSDGTASISTVAAAVKYARLLGVDIINISASVLDSDNVKPLKDEVQNALDSGITVVASAGNDADDASKYVPANIDGVDTVGTAESVDQLSAFKATATTNIGDCVDFYYIADSTSEAAAMETAVLASGKEDMEYGKSGTWIRFREVADRDTPIDNTIMNGAIPLDQLEKEQGFLTAEQRAALESVRLNDGHYTPWVHTATADGGVLASERYQRADGTWNLHISNFYYYPPGTYAEGANGIQIYCQDPDIKAWPEDGKYNCTSTPGGKPAPIGGFYDGKDIAHRISFDGASDSKYDPATHDSESTAYVWTDVNGSLAEGGYSAPTVTVGNGDSTKVHVKVEGNTLKVWFDADWTADMPDDITVTISGGKHKDPTPHHLIKAGTEGTASVACHAPGNFQRLETEGGSVGGTPDVYADGEDGYTYYPANVHLNILRGEYTVHKVDANRMDTTAQGDATLAGAVYEAHHGASDGILATTATTNDSGIAKLSSLKWGMYFIKETTAATGYNLDPAVYRTYITSNGEDPNKTGKDLSEEVVIRGGIALTKNDSDFKENKPQGDAMDLSGTKYDVYNISTHSIFYYDSDAKDYKEIGNTGDKSVTVDGKAATYGNGNYVLTLTTDADGNASTMSGTLSYGTYLIVEKNAPAGYVVENTENSDVTGTMAIVSVRNEGEIVHADMYDDVARGQLVVGKVDLERMANYPNGSDAYAASPDSPDHPQGDASLAGAEFTIYLKSDHHVMIKDANGKHEAKKGEAALMITSDEAGIAKTIEDALPYGSYYVVETKAPEGYLLNTEWRLDFRITKDGEVVDFTKSDGETSYEERAADQVIRGGVELTKFDTDREITKDADKNVPQGDAVLSGAEFTIYNLSKEDILSLEKKDWINPDLSTRGRALAQSISEDQAVAVITTDKSGHAATASNALAYGTYLIKETKAPEGYMLNDCWYSIVEIRDEGKIYDAVADNTKKDDQVYSGTAVDDVIRGGVKLQKVDAERNTSIAQGDATLKNAEITIYNISPLDVYGAYAQDSKDAPQYDGTVSPDGNKSSFHWIASGDKPSSVDADVDVLHKLNGSVGKNPTIIADNAKDGMTDEDGKYSYITNDAFENSTDTAYDDALQVSGTQKSKTETRSFKNAQPVVTIKTDENGIAELGGEALPYGTYAAVETKPSRGYLLNTKWQVVFEIREDGVVVDLTDAEHQLADKVIRGDVRIYKEDLEMSELNGVDRANYGYKSSNKTDASTGTGTDSSYGNETVKTDTKETSGYRPGSESAHHAGVINGANGEISADAENNPSQAIGGKNHGSSVASLNDIEFTITNVSTLSVLSDAETLKEYKPGEFVTTITTHYDAELDTNGDGVADSSGYVAETTGKALPYGTYTIQETKSNDAYMLTDGTPRTFEIEYDGEIADTTKQTHHTADAGEELVFRNQIRRGDFDFTKIAAHTSDRIQSLWVLENDTSGEKHILVTDKNGEFKSYEYSHSDDTNRNDALLETIGTDYEKMIDLTSGIADGSIKESAGVWFGMGEDGSMAKVNDGLGALPYGQYTLHEVRTNTNDGKELQDVTFYVVKNSTFNASGVIEKDSAVHLGTITDEGPSIKTQASADDTKSNVGTAGTTKAILDKISYRDLEPGEYTLKTSLVNAASGAILTDADGNDLVKEETVSVTKTKGSLSVTFDTDTSKFGGLDVVVFEELYRAGDSGELVRVAGHMDRLDSKQTVTFPGVHTTLADTTKKQDKPVSGMMYLTDKVKYNGLEVGKSYTVAGTLHLKNADGTDAGELKDADGNAFTASADFKTKSASGSVNVVFEIPRELLSGETVVAFETLTQGTKTIAVHADINDHDQTVTISETPVIHTTAVNKADGSKFFKVGEDLTVVDTVSYDNLIPGNTYTLYGEIHKKDYLGIDLGVLTDENGAAIFATSSFIPAAKSGTQDVEIFVPASTIPDNIQFSIVVFEKLYEGESPEGDVAARHEDISDAGQTLTHDAKPGQSSTSIKTTLTGTDDAKLINPDSSITLSDKVVYSNINPNSSYIMKGSLHIVNEDGTDGGVIARAEQEFTPDSVAGDITLTFTFDASSLAGQKVVAFETLYNDGKEVASHADLTDEGQTVTFNPVIHTTLTGDNGAKVVKTDEAIKVSDVVAYAGLKPGTEYTMKGELHKVNSDGSDGGVIVTAEQKFTPDRKDGTITLDFTFNSSEMDGQKAVAFETVYEGETEIASHKDLADEGQTVTVMKEVPQIHTTLTGANNAKAVKPETSVKVTDTVRYSGLKPGAEYTLSGDLHKVNANGTDGGVVAKAEKKFTPEKSEGTVTLEFTFDASKLGGRKIVAFETVSQNGYEVASHKDLKDESQTVTVENPNKPSTPTPAPKSTPTPSQNKVSPRIDTGVLGNNIPLSIAIGAAGVILVVILVKRRKKN